MPHEKTIRSFAAVAFCIAALSLQLTAASKNAVILHKPARAGALQTQSEPQNTLREIVRSGRLEDLRWPVFSAYRVHLDNFYRPSGYALAWIRDGAPTPQAIEMIASLQQADQEGLRAEDYDGSRWAERLTALQSPHEPTDEARFDVALTVCAMRLVSDLRIGRINPQSLKFHLDGDPKKLDLPRFVRALLTGTDLKSELESIQPPFKGYRTARKALLRYMELAKADDGEQLPPPIGTVYAGGYYEGIARLIRLLRLVGDLPEGAEVPPASLNTYKGALVEAVKRFQDRHGLLADGNLTSETIEQMNVPLSRRVRQLELHLERFRWLRQSYDQPPIIVNIPEFHLYALREEGGIGIKMNVNVGDADDLQTPIFENSIKYVVFRPYWNVPPAIVRHEIIPAIVQDRNYIHDNGMEIMTQDGHVLTSGRISDAVLQQLRAGKLGVRQKPGPENALGLVKIAFPNSYNIYLHDTPEGVDMFSEQERAFSHGCIHVQEPAELAAWLLRDKPEWTPDRVKRAMHGGRDNVTVILSKPVPILILYGTAAVVGESDTDVRFFRDIYGHDAVLEKALAKGYPYSGTPEFSTRNNLASGSGGLGR